MNRFPKQIVALVQAAMQGDQQAQQQIQQIMQAAQQGDQQAIQIAQLIQQVVQQMQGQQVQSAKFGAKLNYIKHLRGQCPAGYEMQYFKVGGRLCKKCAKKQNGGNVNRTATSSTGQDAINEFRCGSKMKKHQNGGYVSPFSKGKPNSGDLKNELPRKDQNGTKEDKTSSKEDKTSPKPDKPENKSKDPYKEARKQGMWYAGCGGKVKKNAVGGAVNSKEMPISCPCHKKKVRKAEEGDVLRAPWNKKDGTYSYSTQTDKNGNEHTSLWTNGNELYWKDKTYQTPLENPIITWGAGNNKTAKAKKLITEHENSFKPAWQAKKKSNNQTVGR